MATDKNRGGGTEAGRTQPLLSVEDLRTYVFTKAGTVRAVDGVSFSLRAGESMASSASRVAARA